MSSKIQITFFIIVILLIPCLETRLIFVSEVYRHGARGALSQYYDGHNQSSISGQLTATGQRQHYNLGLAIREEYVTRQKFLPPTFDHSKIYVRSDDVDRTIMSAISHFQGIYPESFGAQLPFNLTVNYTLPPFVGTIDTFNYENNEKENTGSPKYAFPHGIQVLPVHMVDKNQDYMFLSDSICPTYWQEVQAFVQEHDDISNKINSEMREVYLQLSQIFNTTFSHWLQIEELVDVLVSDQYNSRPIPYLSQEIWKSLNFLDNFYWFFAQSGSLKATSIITSNIMSTIFNKADSAISHTGNLQWLSLSGHDSNVAPLLRLFNFTNYQCHVQNYYGRRTEDKNPCANKPQFASSIIIEVHENENEDSSIIDKNTIRIRYDGEYMPLCQSSQSICSYTEFKARILQVMPTNFTYACTGGNEYPSIQLSNEEIQNYWEKILILVLFILTTIILVYLRNKSQLMIEQSTFYSLESDFILNKKNILSV